MAVQPNIRTAKIYIYNLCQLQDEFDVSGEWIFFATSHGKSPCDGIGGTIKRITALESLKHPYRNQILSAKAVFDYCNENINDIKFFFSTKEEIEETRAFHCKRYEKVFTIPGTRSFHQFIAINNKTVGLKRCSEDISFKEHSFSKDEVFQPFTIKLSSYVAVVYDGTWWLGNILEIDDAEKDVKVKFLHPKGPSTYFHWPIRDDTCFITYENVLCEINVPKPKSSSLRNYTIESDDINLINNKWLEFISSN